MKNKYYFQSALLLTVMMTCGCHLIMYLIPENPIDIYKREGDEAKWLQNYCVAEENYLNIIAEHKKDGLNIGWPYTRLFWIYYAQGKYDEAINARLQHMRLSPEGVQSSLSSYYCLFADIYLAQGKNDKAYESCDLAFKYAEEQGRKEPQNAGITHVYRPLGMYYIYEDDFIKAQYYFQEFLDYCVENFPPRADFDGRARMQLAMAYFYSGDDQTAADLLVKAADQNASSFVVWEEDLGQTMTMLGRIAEHRGAIDRAQRYYQNAVNVLSGSKPSRYRTQRADALNVLGGFMIRRAKYEEAATAYREAIELRQATCTATHPDNADSLKGLADVAIVKDELTSATTLARQAIDVLDTALVPTHPRIAPILVTLASLYTLAGQTDQAEILFQRTEAILQGPLGMYREDIRDTIAFYRKVMRQKGHDNVAERLTQMDKKAEQIKSLGQVTAGGPVAKE